MKLVKRLLSLILILVVCTSCTSSKQYTAYSIYPIGYILNTIAGNRINSISIQDGSMVQLANVKEEVTEILNDSSVYFHIGGLEPYMDLYEEDVKETGVEVVDLSILNTLYDYKRYTPVVVNGSLSFIEGNFYEGSCLNDINMYDQDLFIWLLPIGMQSMAKDVTDYLASNYVEQSAYFNERYKVLADELIALDAAYNELAKTITSTNKSIKFVSVTGSFCCWQKAYGIQIYPLCLSKYGALPSEEQLAIIKQKIIDDDVKYIAYEPNMSDDMAALFEQVEQELGLKRVTLYNISSLSQASIESNEDYMSLMYKNLNTLKNMISDEIGE